VNVVVDDHLLREVLLEREPTWLRRARRGGQMVTTGTWYYRLCSALQEPAILGRLSGPVASLPADLAASVIQRVAELPDEVAFLSLRELAWSAAELGRRHRLNLLAAEALAAAVEESAAIATTGGNLPPRLVSAAESEGVRILVAPTKRRR
jgi:hypothetical protein